MSRPDLSKLPKVLCPSHEHGPEINPILPEPADAENLEHYLRLQHLLIDAVTDVALGTTTGLFVWGPPGTGKSTAIRRRLDSLKVPYFWTSDHFSQAALVDLFRSHPDKVIAFDDSPGLVSNDRLPTLMSATSGKRSDVRLVGRSTARGAAPARFTGAVIVINNNPLPKTPLGQAFASRVNPLHFAPSRGQLLAMMRSLAEKGRPAEGSNPALTPQETLTVLAEVIQASADAPRLNLRSYDKACEMFCSAKLGQAHTHWAIRFRAHLEQVRPEDLPPSEKQTMAQKKAAKLAVAAEIRAKKLKGKEAAAYFAEKTGDSQASYFNYRKMLRA